MKRIFGIIISTINTKRLASVLILVSCGFMVAISMAGPKDDLAGRKSEFDRLKARHEEMSRKVEDYLEKSRKLREVDKSEMDALISQICRLDIARNDDEADRLAKSIRDKIVDNVKRSYEPVASEGNAFDSSLLSLLNEIRSLANAAKQLASIDEVKDDANRLVSAVESLWEQTNKVWDKESKDYRTLGNLKEGVMNGSNNPRIRAAMEYGKEKHVYNQRICEEKEISLSSGRPDCVSFQKDSCIVWEFKPDTYSESEATSQAEKYLRDVQDKFKDDRRALENCKKDSSGRPEFKAKGVTYPACRP